MQHFEQAIHSFAPGSKLLSSRALEGGISATMTLLEIELPDGKVQKAVARKPGAWRYRDNPNAAKDEFRVIEALQTTSVRVPGPLALIELGPDIHDSYYLLEFQEGAPDLVVKNRDAFLRSFARQLAEIHRVDFAKHGLEFLEHQTLSIKEKDGIPLNSLRESHVINTLKAMTPLSESNSPTLLHGDYWPGNVLWRNEEIISVIDWENAIIGDPLADLASCRLDVLWILDMEAMEEFTERYQAEMNLDMTDLPSWDLWASLRLIRNLKECVTAYPKLGRSDITEETMSSDLLLFIESALARCKTASTHP